MAEASPIAPADLHAHLSQLSAALDAAQLGTWFWDPQADLLNLSPGCLRLLGRSPQQPLRQLSDYIELIVEEDRPQLIDSLAGIDQQPGRELALKHRVQLADGTPRWLELSGQLLIQADGRPSLLGVLRDISQLQQREAEQAATQARYSALFQLNPGPMSLLRYSDGCIIDVNDQFCELFGWSRQDCLGRTAMDLELWVDTQQRDELRHRSRHLDKPVTLGDGVAQVGQGFLMTFAEVKVGRVGNELERSFLEAEKFFVHGFLYRWSCPGPSVRRMVSGEGCHSA